MGCSLKCEHHQKELECVSCSVGAASAAPLQRDPHSTHTRTRAALDLAGDTAPPDPASSCPHTQTNMPSVRSDIHWARISQVWLEKNSAYPAYAPTLGTPQLGLAGAAAPPNPVYAPTFKHHQARSHRVQLENALRLTQHAHLHSLSHPCPHPSAHSTQPTLPYASPRTGTAADATMAHTGAPPHHQPYPQRHRHPLKGTPPSRTPPLQKATTQRGPN